MWKQGGRSSALDRAQALLSAQRQDRGGVHSFRGGTDKTHTHEDGGAVSVITRSVPPAPSFLSDLSDLSSVSSAPHHQAAPAGGAEGRSREPTQDVRPQSSLGGGSRFLKKAPPPSANSSQEPEPRYVLSSQRGYQNATLSRLDQIESRLRSHKQAQERNRQEPKPSESLTSDWNISSLPAAKSLEASVQLSAQSSSEQSLSGKRFLKKTTAANDAAAAASSSRDRDSGFRSVSRAAGAVFPSASWDQKPGRVMSAVSLESDEEDMKKLLGDSLDSMDGSFGKPGRPSSGKTTDKMLGKHSPKIHSTVPPKPAPTPSPASPSHRGSPFRFTGQAQAHFSPSALSPSPSPPHISPSPLRKLEFSLRAESPQRSLSSVSGHSEVMSLDELFPVRSHAEDLQSDISEAFSEVGPQDFKINVMTLDDLVPVNPGFTEEAPDKEAGAEHSPPEHLSRLKEEEKDEQQHEDGYTEDYQSDFESESRTEPDHSVSQVSEHLQTHGDEEEMVKTAGSEVSHGRTDDDYSSSFSDTSRSHTPRTGHKRPTYHRSSDSRSSRSSPSHSRQPRSYSSSERVLKDSAVQTQPDPLPALWSAGVSTLGPAVGAAYTHPSSVPSPQTISAEMVEALSSFNPATFVLNEILKQHLAMTRRFIEANRDLHLRLMKSLEPPNYRYITLEDAKEYIRKQRPPKLTVEEALEDVRRGMNDHHI